ncbi:MAG: peptidylprolyl isomerase [Paludibacter sp.]|nr:MAG: peptidylprolyl isomerase [Paludibacter sp.]
MATLQNIRDKAGVLVAVVIGLSLLAFILGDFLGKGSNGFMNNEPIVGEVNGNKITYQEYQAVVNDLTDITKRNSKSNDIDQRTLNMIYDQAWDMLVMKYTIEEDFQKLGITVGKDELEDMIKGKNIDPQIKQVPIFQDPQTKQFDKARVVTFIKNLDQDPTGEARASWIAFEDNLVKNKINTKYTTLLQKAYYPNKLEVENQVKGDNDVVDFEYVYKKYSEVGDDQISFTDEDLKKYYEAHKYKFKQEESRNITYVTFDILPSNEDDLETKKVLEKQAEDFASIEDPIQYIMYNSDQDFNDTYYAEGELPANIDTFMFNENIGAVTDIYKDANAYKIAKLINIKELPDSAHARHILLQASEQMPVQEVINLSDSLQELLKNGADFAELALKYSQDKGSAIKGGDLDWFKKGAMVKPFEKACFEGKVGDIQVVESQYGLHIIEVLEQGVKNKKVQVGYLTANITPSEQTIGEVYNKASEFAGKNRTEEQFTKAAEELKMVPRVANNLKKTDRNIAGLESPRELIKWAYNNELGAVSENVFEFGDKYVVAVLTEVKEKGDAPFENVKAEVENSVIKEKKAQVIMEEMKKGGDNLESIAQAVNKQVQTASKIALKSFSIPGAGAEPVVIATALYGTPNKVTAPIEGNTGVFVIKPSEVKTENKATAEGETEKLRSAFSNRLNYQAVKSIKDASDITDNRINFN